MAKKTLPVLNLSLDAFIGGGQTIGTLPEGKKCMVWGGLPGEEVSVQITRKKSSYAEGYVTEVIKPSPERIAPHDEGSFLSTSPWQIMKFEAEERHKADLIMEAFALHHVTLPGPMTVWTDGREYEYRNKVEFSFWYDTDKQTLDLAFFRRGSHGKIAIDGTSLAAPIINKVAHDVRNTLRDLKIDGRSLKTLLIRSNRAGQVAWQLYVKDESFDASAVLEKAVSPEVICAEVIYSNPKSPASVITKRLAATSDQILTDTILDIPFRYATEGFFQINLPVYEQALRDMQQWVDSASATETRIAGDGARGSTQNSSPKAKILGADNGVPAKPVSWGEGAPAGPASSDLRGNSKGISDDGRGRKQKILDLYSGVGTIGLTIGGDNVTLVEMNEHAVREMERNIDEHNSGAKAVLAASENALDYITGDATIIVDPPRAGLHEKVVDRLLETAPPRIVYLSCNPVTQARDVARLAEKYGISWHQGYNFFPRTPHIEHLVILDIK